ncbi:MAG: hypothetical protein AAF843_08845 [Bacteroidota bacterium]
MESRRHLEKAVSELREFKAPDVWLDIEAALSTPAVGSDNNLKDAIRDLKSSEAPDVWLPIEASLPKVESKQRFIYWSVAASVSMLIISLVLFYQSSFNRTAETISYSTEEVDFFETSLDISLNETADDKILEYVKRNCKRLSQSCQNPEFKGLLETYMELTNAKQQLEMELAKSTNQSQLMKYLIRVEKNQTEVGKDMLKKLKWS